MIDIGPKESSGKYGRSTVADVDTLTTMTIQSLSEDPWTQVINASSLRCERSYETNPPTLRSLPENVRLHPISELRHIDQTSGIDHLLT